MNLQQVVDNRDKGQIPVSIGTSLALEAADGQYPDRPIVEPPPIKSISCLMVNVRTLYRNMLGAVDRERKDALTPELIVPALLEELHIIESFAKERSEGRCSAVFYISNYGHLTQKQFPGAIFKIPSTEKQKRDSDLESRTLSKLVARNLPSNFMLYKGQIEGRFPASFIITHLPLDLLSRPAFQKLELLESHTGNIKTPGMWGSKLSGKDLDHIPFNPFTLKVFGDGVQFMGQRPSVKKAVLEVAQIDRWSGLTTMPLIEYSVTKIKDRELRESVESLL